mgnify:CR=1 FL=1
MQAKLAGTEDYGIVGGGGGGVCKVRACFEAATYPLSSYSVRQLSTIWEILACMVCWMMYWV